jgi:molecular chaperone HtpG
LPYPLIWTPAYQLGGVADFLLLQPTAGREALTTESQDFLNSFAAPLDALISDRLAERAEANVSQSFINWAAAHQRWDLCGEYRRVCIFMVVSDR